MKFPELGNGIIYFSGFEQILEANPDLIQLVEIEPQTFWYRNPSGLASYTYDEEPVAYLKNLGKPLLFHGVGFPVGGVLPSDASHLNCLQQMCAVLSPVAMSEHLSFNTIELEEQYYNTNFLLPILQTEAGIKIAAESILKYKKNFDIPFAFETGVNYLSPKPFELPDGYFVNKIAEEADCYLLLDVHNILANEKNGRQPVADYFKQLSHEKITQIHLAGGFYYKNYYLDAHSDVSSDEVIAVFEKIVRQLPNLKAITFEMLPEYMSFVAPSAITLQLQKMNRIWEKRGANVKQIKRPNPVPISSNAADCPTAIEWETTLGMLAIGKLPTLNSTLFHEIMADKGLQIIRDLIEKFRSSLVISSLKLTCRYLMLKYGIDEFNKLLRKNWEKAIPKLFASDNGIDFAIFLLTNEIALDESLQTLIKYEIASLSAQLENREVTVELSFHPLEMVECLSNLRLFDELKKGNFSTTIVPNDLSMDKIKTVFHT